METGKLDLFSFWELLINSPVYHWPQKMGSVHLYLLLGHLLGFLYISWSCSRWLKPAWCWVLDNWAGTALGFAVLWYRWGCYSLWWAGPLWTLGPEGGARVPPEEARREPDLLSLCVSTAAGWATSRPTAKGSSLCLRRVSTPAGTRGPAVGGRTRSAPWGPSKWWAPRPLLSSSLCPA